MPATYGRVAILGSRGYPSSYGGFETLVRRLAPFLVELGYEVIVYSRADDRPRQPAQLVEGILRVETPGISTTAASTLSHGFTSAVDARRRCLDAALVLNCANGFFLPLLSRAGVPTAVNVDGLEWQRAKWGPLARRVFFEGARLTGRFASEIIVDSQAIGDVWRAQFGRESVFIPYGADCRPQESASRVRRLGLTPGAYVLVVARLVPENNIDLLLDALRLMPSIPAVIVGSARGSVLERKVCSEAQQRSTVTWLGHVDDQELLAELWSHCAVYFHGHSAGGTNPALLQAMGFGSPVVALDTVFNREVLEYTEQLVGPDARAIADRLTAVISDRGLAEKWSERGRRIVSERYQWHDVCDRYARVLRRLTEGTVR